jgi:hypothetical protein
MTMTPKMPRGAIPTPRSEFAASEPYRPESGAEIFSPSGEFPTPNYELAAAQPCRARLWDFATRCSLGAPSASSTTSR